MSLKILAKDAGIRPAGEPDECFYCRGKVGQDHTKECVIPSKLVRLKVTAEIDVEVPWNWTAKEIDFHRNESSWCVDNILRDFEQHIKLHEDHGCLCQNTVIKYIKTVDETPLVLGNGEKRKLKE